MFLSWALGASHYTWFSYAILSMSEVFEINVALKTYNLVSQVGNLSEETTKYFENLNMNQNSISSGLSHWELGPLTTCDYSTKYSILAGNSPTVEQCIFNELGKNFNFSYRFPKRFYYARVIRRRTMSMDYLNGEIKRDRRYIVTLGFVYDQWGYFVSKERLHNYDTALIGPFDTLSWISILLSISGLAIVFLVILKYSSIHAFSQVEKLFRILIYFFGSLLDQSVSTLVTQLPVLGHATKSLTKFLWLSWCFSAFLLGQLYKGEMFSFLTKSPEPDYPTSLENLARSGLLMYSFTGSGYNGKHIATFALYLQEVMSAPNASYPEYYHKFRDSLIYMHEWLNGMRDLTRNMYLQENVHLIDKNKSDANFGDKVSKSFASFDYLKHMFMHKQLLKLYFPNKWTSPVVSVFGFMSTMPWTVDKNFFYPIFKRGLGQIYESGLYNRWDRYHDSYNGLDSFSRVRNLIKDTGALNESDIKTSVPEKNWRNSYYHYLYNRESKQERKVFEPVSIMLLKIVWILAGILLGISVLLLLLELLHNQDRKWKEDMVILF